MLSLACIVLGVGFFVVTQAITAGFQQLFITTLLGTDGAIRIQDKMQDTLRSMYATGNDPTSSFQIQEKEGMKYIEGIPQPKQLMEELSHFGPNIAGMAEVLHEDVIATSSFKSDSAQVFGIQIDDLNDDFLKVSSLKSEIMQGSLDDFRERPDGVIIGSVLAARLQLAPGDTLLITPTFIGADPRRYRVSAIYETGVEEIDRVRLYLHLNEARSLLHKTTEVSYIQIKLFDRDRAPADAAQMQAALKYSAAPWQEREAVWLGVFRALQVLSAVIVSIFTVIAGLAMFNTLLMIVMEKTKEIAILRSMGYTPADISSIFIWQAAIVLTIGCLIGWAMGAGITFGLGEVPLQIRGIFKTDTFPIHPLVSHYVEATIISIVVVMIASVVPARRAARLEPGDVIRGTAQ